MSDIELPPLGKELDWPFSSGATASDIRREVYAYARAAVELNASKASSADVEAMCDEITFIHNRMDGIAVYSVDAEQEVLRRAIAMLRSLDAQLTHTEDVCDQVIDEGKKRESRIAALEAALISKQIQIDTLEMLRERAAPPVDQYAILPPPATISNSSGDSSSSTGTSSTISSTTGFSMDAPVCTGEVPGTGTIDQYHELRKFVDIVETYWRPEILELRELVSQAWPHVQDAELAARMKKTLPSYPPHHEQYHEPGLGFNKGDY